MIQLFEPGNVDELAQHITRLYQDKARRASLVEESDRFNQRYNWTVHSQDYVALVDQLNTR